MVAAPEMLAKLRRQLAATDLLTRDANLGLVVLDLRHATERALRRTPASFWYRLQRAVESTDLALVVITPRTTVPSAPSFPRRRFPPRWNSRRPSKLSNRSSSFSVVSSIVSRSS